MKTARELEIPARSWVPDRVAIATVFLIMLPIAMLNGTYTGSMVEVSNTLGVYTEDITIGYYAAAAGMAVSYPIVPKILGALSGKSLLLTDLTLQFFLSWFCARQSDIELVITASFIIGFLKGFLMLWIIRRIKFIFSPKDIRSEFYAYFYPLVFGSGQLSMVITALLADHYDWKYMYYFMMLLLLAAILGVIVFFRHNRPSRPIPWKELHAREMLIIATGVLMLIYVITYGKTLDWMAYTRIRLYIVVAPLLVAIFLWEQFHSPRPYVSLKPLFQWKAIVGYFYMMMVMFFSTSTSLLTSYLTTHPTRGQHAHLHTLRLAAAGLSAGSLHLLLVVPLATVALPLPHSRRDGVLRPVLRHTLLRHFAGQHVRNALLAHVPPRAWYADADYRLRPLCRRRPATQVPAFQCFLPHHLPFSVDTCHRLGLLQQRTLPPAAEIYGETIRNPYRH